MQQDTFFYQTFPHQDPGLQYPNAGTFSAPANVSTWPNTYVPEVNLNQAQNVPNPYNLGNATPVSTAVYGSTATFSWAHTVPSLMPWVTQGADPNVPDSVMRFTAPFPPDPCTSQTATSWELLNNLGAKTNVNMHLKRKSELDALEAAAPHKMCITEEKMSARLRELHISNQYSVPTESSPFGPYSSNSSSSSMADKSVTNIQQLEAMIKGTQADGSTKSLVLAPELKKLVEPEKIFASTFLDKIERPSMAVVLWQPQTKLLPNLNSNSKTEEEDKESTESLSQQLNTIRNVNSVVPSSEDIMDT